MEEIKEEEIEEGKYNPFRDGDIFSIEYNRARVLFHEHDCLSGACGGEIELYDASYIYAHPHHKFKTYEVGIKPPVRLHAALWKELLNACKLMEFTEEEGFSEKAYTKYISRVQFDVPDDPEKRIQLFSGLRRLKDTIRYMLDNVPTLLYIKKAIDEIDCFV